MFGGPVIAGLATSNLIYNAGTTVARNLRELADEEDGDIFFVYYPLGNVGGAAAELLLPESFY